MKRALAIIFLALLGALSALTIARAAGGAVSGDAVRGGKLYDNWMLALDLASPEGNQPLWSLQETNPRSGVVTWRCAECHGWDYKGADGVYGPASNHYTGFTGLDDMIGAPQSVVEDWLSGAINPSHNFLFYTNPIAIQDLTAFLRTQQVDMDLMISPTSGEALGDIQAGEVSYNANCASCHGSHGDLINFGSTSAPLFLADLAVSDPWQTAHKIRFGSASNERMPATEEMGWSLTRVADVLAYAQTLRRGNPSLTPFSQSSNEVEVERQGQIEPLIWATFVLFAIIFISVAGDAYRQGDLPAWLRRRPARRVRR